MQELLAFVVDREGKLNDSVHLHQIEILADYYRERQYRPAWSDAEQFVSGADSLFQFVRDSKRYGLFPADYHWGTLQKLTLQVEGDSLSRKNVAIWTKIDLLYSAALLNMGRDLRKGHLPNDSITLRKDSLYDPSFWRSFMQKTIDQKTPITALHSLEPNHPGYHALKESLRHFLDSVRFVPTTYLMFPNKDSVLFQKNLEKRLREGGYLSARAPAGDTNWIRQAILVAQAAKGLKASGKVNEALVRSLNNTAWERYKRIAINLDRYRQLPTEWPEHYVWVNLPSFTLLVYEADTVAFQSKVIVGSPRNRTPVLNSEITQFITYPQWTVPYSIIFKEMLPKIQQDINYLQRQNLMVVDKNDSVINPATIDWSQLNAKKFPYLLRQRQGDDNSLGVMKFNFRNKYSVYLHDTNARSLFSRKSRALSHGCVRVQAWEKLAHFLVRTDSLQYPSDTLRAWIQRSEKHIVSDFPPLPLYIRYFTVEGVQGSLRWWEDIYGDDRRLSERYFVNKRIQ